jgi:hypothetical protein
MWQLDLNLNQRNRINFAKNHHLDQEKIVKDSKNGSKHANLWLGMPPRKLKRILMTYFASKVILFKEGLDFNHVIVLEGNNH